MTLRLRFLLPLVALCSTVPPAAAQVGTTTDIITGTVTGPDSQPLAGAIVEATSLETQLSRRRETDQRGYFTILFPDGGGQYRLTARYIGMAPAELTVRRQGDDERLVANIRMGALPLALEPVTVSSRRAASPGNISGGTTAQSLSPDQMARLPVDATDLNAVAALAPGVLPLTASDSTTSAFSVAGQRTTANNVTLDGMGFGTTGTVPADALRSTRVVTNTYDVARGQFSGGLVTATTRSGTNTPEGSLTYVARQRSLAWGEATASPFGAGLTQNQASGGFGGPIVPDRLFIFGALQGRGRDQALPSLATADPATLLRLGVSPDSATRFRALASATGAPATMPDLSADRATENALGLVRLDWRISDAHSLTLRFDGRWESQEPSRVSPLALPATGGTRSELSGGVLVSLTSSLGERFVNEARAYVAASRRNTSPFLALPVARVQVTSELPDVGEGVAVLAFGGNAALPQYIKTQSLEMSDEISLLPGNGAHRPKLGFFVNATRNTEIETPNQFGTFTYPSLAALAADSPSTFTRSRAPLAQAGTAWNEALYLGDSWHLGEHLRLTYGFRVEGTRFTGAPAYNRAVDTLFRLRTDLIPGDIHVSPRIGVTWGMGGGPGQAPPTYLRGGVGLFQSPIPTFLYSAALGAPGSANAETDLTCVGATVPTPDWAAYARDPSAIPSQCALSGSTATVLPSPNVIAFDPGFTAPRVWRGSIGLVQRVWGRYWATLEGSYARGVSQYGFRDVNLVQQPRFMLPEENRPVYVPPDSIVPTTGQLSFTASRIHPEFGRVLAIRSDLRSDTRQVTFAFGGSSARGAVYRLAYTLTRSRDQSSYACCVVAQGYAAPTTAFDPGALEWGTSDLERRHALVGTVSYPLSAAFEVGAVGRLMSGVPFTPLVGSDINGDGARNDRAFIFDPRTETDTAIANGMGRLLAEAPAAVRNCLMQQLGQIAARNSCAGEWQPSFDLQLNWRPGWFGSERRLTLSVLTVNLLAAVDQWLHGSDHLRGWGYAAAPDPVLLYVQGFDPVTQRYRYAVNDRFGAVASAGNGVIVPFQIGFQGRLLLGQRLVRLPRFGHSSKDRPSERAP